MKIVGFLALMAMVVLTGCQNPAISGGKGNHQTTQWQFSVIDTVNAYAYVGGAPVGRVGCVPGGTSYGGYPPPGYGRPPQYGQPYYGGNGLMRDGNWIPQWGVNCYRRPPRPPYGGYPPQNCGQRPPQPYNQGRPGRVIVNNENINNNNNSIRYIRD